MSALETSGNVCIQSIYVLISQQVCRNKLNEMETKLTVTEMKMEIVIYLFIYQLWYVQNTV